MKKHIYLILFIAIVIIIPFVPSFVVSQNGDLPEGLLNTAYIAALSVLAIFFMYSYHKEK